MENVREAVVYGVRPVHLFRDAAERYIYENQHIQKIKDFTTFLINIDAFIGELDVKEINNHTIQPWIKHRKKTGVKNRTINHELKCVTRILNLCANEWFDNTGLSWLLHAPKIKLLQTNDSEQREPLTWEHQDKWLPAMASPFDSISLFAINTGAREQEIASLQCDWYQQIETDSGIVPVFVIPAKARQEIYIKTQNGKAIAESRTFNIVKSKRQRVLVLNDVADNIARQFMDCRYVFANKYGYRYLKLHTNTFKAAKQKINERLGTSYCFHTFRHTFQHRLRAKGVDESTVSDLVDHATKTMTHHYSAPDLERLHVAVQKITERKNTVLLSRVGKLRAV